MSRIMHVTETLGAGVMGSVSMLARSQASLGHIVVLLHTNHADMPAAAELDCVWFAGVERRVLEYNRSASWSSIRSLSAQIVASINQLQPDVVHAHSTVAGIATRLAWRQIRRTAALFYSPHGFAFLRSDWNPAIRTAVVATESALARRCTGLVLVSESEKRIARRWLRAPRIDVLQNAVDCSALPEHRPSSAQGGRPRIGVIGRITEQKAPERVVKLAYALQDDADVIWFGDGTPAALARWMSGEPPVEITGWLDHDELLRRISQLDLVVMPSLFEGMPMSLLEAQGIGIPVVGTNVVGIRDVIENGRTGDLIDHPDHLIDTVRALLSDPSRLARYGTAAAIRARTRFDATNLGERSESVYRINSVESP